MSIIALAIYIYFLLSQVHGQYHSRDTVKGGLLRYWRPKDGATIVVARDGTGHFNTINQGIEALSKMKRTHRSVVYVKAGTYNEIVRLALDDVMFVGDGIDRTIITGNRNISFYNTMNTSTFMVTGKRFWARGITFQNTAGAKMHQAVALAVVSDMSIFYYCAIKGNQDSLLAHANKQFYSKCNIHGTVDFIFGNAAAVFQWCNILARTPLRSESQYDTVTAQGRNSPYDHTGFVIQESSIMLDKNVVAGRFQTYLGRPWKKFSRTVIIKSQLGDLVNHAGWAPWSGRQFLSTLYYAEFENTGRGAPTYGRVKWPGFHILHDGQQAERFSVRNFLHGLTWIPESGISFKADI